MYTKRFSEIGMDSLSEVGGKNASLGEMFGQLTTKGIHIPDGFATTAEAYWQFINENELFTPLENLMNSLDREDFSNLREVGEKARNLILSSTFSSELEEAIRSAYNDLVDRTGEDKVAVRSSATAEDLPTASFAGQLESFLNVSGHEQLLEICQRCYASLFTDRAIKYREDNGFEHMKVALSVGVQQMVHADTGCSGVAFTIDPETGFDRAILITGAWGLGENVVQGTVDPDEYVIYKPALIDHKLPIIAKKRGTKKLKMVYAQGIDHQPGTRTANLETSTEEQNKLTLDDEQVIQLAQWCLIIEEHYGKAMDIEWAIDGATGQLYIVQARPETVHSQKDPHQITTFQLKSKGANELLTGVALGDKIAAGKAKILHSPKDSDKLKEGDVLITGATNPDWDPIMKRAAAIVTDSGGRTSHAAIVARELGVVAVVGTGDATSKIKDGQEITVSCAEGKVGKIYDGTLEWEETSFDTSKVKLPSTDVMLILADPGKAFRQSFLPNKGVGLMRMEFVINNEIEVHPLALTRYDEIESKETKAKIDQLTINHASREDYFVESLAEAVGMMAAAFEPHDVIVRMSDFKSNEYANLLGGDQFEPDEENPMIGFRGASRYYSDDYRDGFRLECLAMKRVREEMGFENVKLMIPFCRTVEEAEKVIAEMKKNGLERGKNGLELYMMIEIPSNVVMAEEFAKHFDGFSIGSNDLTQLTLGLDRDNAHISHLFKETDPAVQWMIKEVIGVAKRTGTRIGLCGQAPSDIPEFAEFLINEGIDSISFNPDALIKGIKTMNKVKVKK